MKKILILLLILAGFITGLTAQNLSTTETNNIIRLWEEEKMARDVYMAFYDKWKSPVFKNISASEKYHMTQMWLIAEKFNLQTNLKDIPGEFTNKEINQLYTRLLEQGSNSREDAFRAGALLEETDISDLKKAIESITDKQFQTTLKYLLKASENHLRAFTRNISRTGNAYEPSVLPRNEFNEIIRKQN